MSPFFSSAADSSIGVAQDFLIYWIITIPLTATVLLSWAAWHYQRWSVGKAKVLGPSGPPIFRLLSSARTRRNVHTDVEMALT
jgi:hypothetical protein